MLPIDPAEFDRQGTVGAGRRKQGRIGQQSLNTSDAGSEIDSACARGDGDDALEVLSFDLRLAGTNCDGTDAREGELVPILCGDPYSEQVFCLRAGRAWSPDSNPEHPGQRLIFDFGDDVAGQRL